MSLHDKIMNIAVGHKGRQSIGKLLYNTGYKDARRDAAELAKQYDSFVDDFEDMLKTIISLQAGAFSSEDGSSYEMNIVADMAEEMLIRLGELK